MARRALGKGLSSLIPQAPARKRVTRKPEPARPSPDGVQQIDLDRIRPNREQPRKDFDDGSLQELAQSLKNQGVIQPVVVRGLGDGQYELIVGERRWRSAQIAGLLKIPALVRDVSDDKLLELALIENIQREQLNPIEAARAFQSLIDDLGLSHEEIAERVGKQRSTVTNTLRLLNLPPAVQDKIRAGLVSLGHAKALAGLSSPKHQVQIAERIAREALSVRQVETLVGRIMGEAGAARVRKPGKRDPNVEAAEDSLQRALGTKVRIVQGAKGRGRLELHFFSDEELQRVYQLVLNAAKRSDHAQP
jgi:ParB family chromosome partitioning protein